MLPLVEQASMNEFGAIWLTAKLAALTTVFLLLIGTPIAWWLANSTSRFKPIVEAITALPLVLPPTVLGFYLLLILNPTAPIGAFWVQVTGETLTFSFTGLLVASIFYSLPFMVQPLQTAFENVGKIYMETAASLRANRLDGFFTVVAPLSLRGFTTACVLTFAHTLGEFGVVLMVGGNIPGETRVISIAIYENVETLNYAQAHFLSLILVAFSFVVLVCAYTFNRKGSVHIA